MYNSRARHILRKEPFVPNATAWYDASYGATLNSTTVSALVDKSGNGYSASQGTSTKQPTYNASGIRANPSITYTNAASPDGDFFSTNALATFFTGNDMPFSISCVLNYSAFTGSTMVFWTAGNSVNTNSYIFVGITDTTGFINAGGRGSGTTKNVTGTTALTAGTSYVISIVSNGTTISSWINGVLDINGGDIDVGSKTIDIVSIGGFIRNSEANFFNGDIPEFLIYDSAISDSRRIRNETYLRNKYHIY